MKLGAYEVESEIARGGMGVVYRARSPTGRLVALKVVATDVERTDSGRIRFDREAQAARSVQHENVVQLLDRGRERGTTFLVFELVTGGSLHDRVKSSGPLGWREAARLGAGVARGLAAIHAAGIVHRDLKPSNVLLEGETPKVADLGLARQRGGAAAQALTRTGELIGTPQFIAPEQVEDGRTVDARADLYALGGTLHFLLTGEPPFEGNALALVKAHLTKAPPHPRTRNASVPEALDALVVRLLAKEPIARGASAEAVARELDAIALGSARRVKKRGILLLAMSTLVAAGAAALLVARSGEKHVAPPRPPAAVVAPPPKTPVAPSKKETPIRAVAFSPNGALYATGSDDGLVRVYSTEGRALRRTLEGLKGSVRAVAWTPDGSTLAAGDERGQVWEWPLEGGAGRWLVTHGDPGEPVTAVAYQVTPGGGVVILSAGRDHELRFTTLDESPHLIGHEHERNSEITAIAPDTKHGSRVLYGTTSGKIVKLESEIGGNQHVDAAPGGERSPVVGLAVAADAERCVCAHANGRLVVFDITGLKTKGAPIGPREACTAFAYASAKDEVLLAGPERVTLWELGRATPLRTFDVRDVAAMALSSDGEMVALSVLGEPLRVQRVR